MTTMPTPPPSTKTSLGQHLRAHARNRWPQLADIEVRFRGNFAYQDSILPHGQPAGSPQEALDCACGLYLNDPTAWHTSSTPTN
jgi:hypothetical protein